MKKMYEWTVVVLIKDEEGKTRLESVTVEAPNICVAAQLSDMAVYDMLVKDPEAVSGEIVNLFRGEEVIAK